MAVRLEGAIRRYAGLSTDDKPASTGDDTIPVNSIFFETDTWRLARWDGTKWAYQRSSDEDRSSAVHEELVKIRQLLECIV